jgi:hypothetical protein
MVIDYKGVTFSFKARKRKRLLKRIRSIAVLVFIVFLFFIIKNCLDSGGIKKVQRLLLEGNLTEAAAEFKDIEGGLLHGKTKEELRALLYLFQEDPGSADRARETLASLHSRNTLIDFQNFLAYFSDHAGYRSLKIYTDFLLKVKRGDDLLLYKALYHSALLDFNGSVKAAAEMPAKEKEKHQPELAIIHKINNELKAGKVHYIFDVNGLPMAYYDPGKEKTVSLTPGMRFDAFNKDMDKSLKFYSLTIDLEIQKKLHRLFKKNNYHGTFLLFNLNDSGMAAAYSSPLKNTGNPVFSERYEPGSIMKLLTLLAYLRSGPRDLFPFECKGSFTVNGKVFYDWIRHNRVSDYEEALAVSCNLGFANMGIKLGIKELAAVFKAFYFNSDGLRDLFLHFPAGIFNEAAAGDLQLANLAVGLEEITVTTFHAALISAIITQNGSIYSPYLVKNKKNLLNLAYYKHPSQLLRVFDDSAAFLKIKNAMVRVVEDKNGTGKRAKSEFVRVGLKTGTAGERKRGLDAVLTGFFPVEKPQYAFAFRLEHVGKAELKGAYFLRDFLTAFYRQR